MKPSAAGRNRGVTLIEMMIVISVILILSAIAVPIYSQSVTRAREENLRKNLWTLNEVIAQYTMDKQKGPRSLNDLQRAGYIESIPEDITGRNDTWAVEDDGAILTPEQTETGITGVHSGSNQVAIDGTAYSSW
jgi:general secretion pathway protein G